MRLCHGDKINQVRGSVSTPANHLIALHPRVRVSSYAAADQILTMGGGEETATKAPESDASASVQDTVPPEHSAAQSDPTMGVSNLCSTTYQS